MDNLPMTLGFTESKEDYKIFFKVEGERLVILVVSPKIDKKNYRLVKTNPMGIIITCLELHALLILSISLENYPSCLVNILSIQ